MALSPMMREYMKCKEEYKGCILFYRVGDFFEMFFDDAVLASKELEIALTGKDCGLEERAPMCGVPFHAVDTYIDRLVRNGHKVAICDQVEDPKTAKGLVKREVIRVVTPGTNLSTDFLDEDRHRYIMCILYMDNCFGVAVCDVSTGEFLISELSSRREMLDEIIKVTPAEIVSNEDLMLSGIDFAELENRYGMTVGTIPYRFFSEDNAVKEIKDHFALLSLTPLGIDNYKSGILASGALLGYLRETQKNDLSQITDIVPLRSEDYMNLDGYTIRNLELTETIREKRKNGSLLWVIDKTRTAMGARLLRGFVERPLVNRQEIEKRQECVEALVNENITCQELREYLNPVYDLERLAGRIAYKSANPRDLIALSSSLEMLPAIKYQAGTLDAGRMKEISEIFDPLEDLRDVICEAIVDEPPLAVREGGIIRDGYSNEVDEYRNAKKEGTQWLAEMESAERERTGISTLRIKYNRVFGYCIEVTNSFKDKVPDNYIRRQTLTNAERYTTPELKELEDKILGASDKLNILEYDIFCSIRDKLGANIKRIQETASLVAEIDAYCSLAHVAVKNRYVRPHFNDKGVIKIKDGRHPFVEKMVRDGSFIPNDTYMDNKGSMISVITGPNMAGKSTYMRQVALIVLMAQIGSFVPAKEADIGIVDKIFTRVGASDDLASGQSTFMVEMNEVANILRNATSRSLLILDEIGRGTSTFDGLSIAWAVIEYVADPDIMGARTLFATHYHELTELEGKIPGVVNYCIAVRENGDDIVFLRKIIKGGADRSYGIQVARLAGIPEKVLSRAGELSNLLSDADITDALESVKTTKKRAKQARPDDVDMNQLSFFDTVKDEDILKELKDADISNMTPIDALNFLYGLQGKLANRWKEEDQGKI